MQAAAEDAETPVEASKSVQMTSNINENQRNRRVTITVVVMTSVYVVCQVPSLMWTLGNTLTQTR